MKTREESDALKKDVETLNKKLAELNEDEIEQVTGGGNIEHEDYNAPFLTKDPNSCVPDKYNSPKRPLSNNPDLTDDSPLR